MITDIGIYTVGAVETLRLVIFPDGISGSAPVDGDQRRVRGETRGINWTEVPVFCGENP